MRNVVLRRAFLGLALASPALAFPQDQSERAARLHSALVRSPRPGPVFDRWLQCELESGDLPALSARCRDRAEQSGRAVDALILGLLLQRTGQEDEALTAFERAAQLDPTQSLPHQLRGALLSRLRRLEDALPCYEAALQREPAAVDRMGLLMELARVRLRLGREDEAMAAWEQLLRDSPDDRILREELADVLASEGRDEKALELWREARRLADGDLGAEFTATLEIALLLERTGDPDEAQRERRAMLSRLDGASWQAEAVRAAIVDTFESRGDREGLADFFEAFLDERPGDLAARRAFLQALLRIGERDRAIDELRATIRRAPRAVEFRQMLIVELARAWRHEEAITACEERIALWPDDLDARELLGALILRSAGMRPTPEHDRRAIAAWATIAEHAPDDAAASLRVAHLCLGTAEGRRRRSMRRALVREGVESPMLEAAERHYREALQRDAERAESYEAYGEYLRACGRAEEAAEQWRRMAEAPRDTPENLERLADVLHRHDQHEEATLALEQAVERAPDPTRLLEKLVRRLVDQTEGRLPPRLLEHLAALEALALTPADRERCLRRRVEAEVRAQTTASTRRELEGRPADGRSARDWWLLGLLQIASEGSSEAVESLRRAEELDPENPQLELALAEAMESAGQLAPAAQQYWDIVARHAELAPRCLERITLLEVARERLDAAGRAVETLLERAPGSVEYTVLAADVFRRQGDEDRALDVLRRAVRLTPADVGLRTLLAQTLVDLQRPDEALEHFWQAFLDEEGLPERRALSQELGRHAGEHGQLARFADRMGARRRHQDDEGLDLCLGDLLLAGGSVQAALDHLGGLHQRDPLNALVIEELVDQASEAGRHELAADYQEKLVNLDARLERLERLVELQSAAGRREEARDTCMWILEEHPEKADSLVQEIRKALNAQQPAVAADLAAAGVEVSPSTPGLRLWAGLLFLNNGDRAEAMEHLEAFLETEVSASPSSGLPARTQFSFGSSDEIPLPPVTERLDASSLPGWFEDALVEKLATIPLSQLEDLLRWAADGPLKIEVDRSQNRFEMTFEGPSVSGSSGGGGGAGPSFEAEADYDMLYRAWRRVTAGQDRSPPGPRSSNRFSTLSRLGYLGYEESEPDASGLGDGLRDRLSRAALDSEAWHPQPPALPVEWPQNATFTRLENSIGDLEILGGLDDAEDRLPPNFRLQMLEQIAQGPDLRRVAMAGALRAAGPLGEREDSLWRMAELCGDRAEDLVDLACLAWILEEHEVAHTLAEQLLDLEEDSDLAASLALLELSKLETDEDEEAEGVVEAALEAFERLAEQSPEDRFHLTLAMCSQLARLDRADDCAPLIEAQLEAGMELGPALEFVPGLRALDDPALKEELFACILEEAELCEDPHLLDGALLALAREGPELYWFETLDLLLNRILNRHSLLAAEDAEEEPAPALPLESTISLRSTLDRSVRMRFGFPLPALGIDGPGLALLSLLHQRAREIEMDADLVDVVTEAAEAALDSETATLRYARCAMQWWSGEREAAIEALEELRREQPGRADLTLSAAFAAIEQEDVLGALRLLRQLPPSSGQPEDPEAQLETEARALVELNLLLGPADAVVDGLLERLQGGATDEELSVYFPTESELERAREAATAWRQSSLPAENWLQHRRCTHDPRALIAAADVGGRLDELSAALGASTEPRRGALSMLCSLRAGRTDAATVMFDRWQAGLTASAELAGLAAVYDETSKVPALTAASLTARVRLLAGALQGAASSTTSLELMDGLARALLVETPDEERFSRHLAARAGMPAEPAPEILDFVTSWLRDQPPNRRLRLLDPLVFSLVPQLQGEHAGGLLRTVYPDLVRQHLDELQPIERRGLMDSLLDSLFVEGPDGLPTLRPQELGLGMRHYPVLSAIALLAREEDQVGDLSEFLAHHPDSGAAVLLACRAALATAAQDAVELERLETAIVAAGDPLPSFDADLGGPTGSRLEVLSRELETQLLKAANAEERARISLDLAVCLCHLRQPRAAARYVDLALRKDTDRARERCWMLIIPSPERMLPPGLVQILGESLKAAQDQDSRMLRALCLGQAGDHSEALNALSTTRSGPSQPERSSLVQGLVYMFLGHIDPDYLDYARTASKGKERTEVDRELERWFERLIVEQSEPLLR